MGPGEVAWYVDRYSLPHGEEVAAVGWLTAEPLEQSVHTREPGHHRASAASVVA